MELINRLSEFLKLNISDDVLEKKYNSSVESHYFKRFFISWLFFNWKAIIIVFLDNRNLIINNNKFIHTSKIEWIQKLYPHDEFSTYLTLIIFPAISPVLIYFVLEILNVLSFVITKYSWKYRVKIQNSIFCSTNATNRMVSEYLDEKEKRDLKIIQLTNEHKNLEIDYNELVNELKEANIQNASLNIELLNQSQSRNTKKIEQKAKETIKKILNSPNKTELLAEYKSISKKIKRENNSFEYENISEVFTTLCQLELFEKDKTTNKYSVTKLGDYVSYILVLEHSENKAN